MIVPLSPKLRATTLTTSWMTQVANMTLMTSLKCARKLSRKSPKPIFRPATANPTRLR